MDRENGLEWLSEILRIAAEKGASDIHLAAAMPVMYRVDGSLVPLSGEKAEQSAIEIILKEMLTEEQRQGLEQRGALDLAYSVPEMFASEEVRAKCGRLRVNIFRQQGNYAMALRLLPHKAPAAERLGLPESVVELTGRKKGLVLVTGQSGSGKSTTIAALLETIANKDTKMILTLEKPVEYLYSQNRSMVLQREIGSDCISYGDALRAALHQDADVIFVGELRDRETVYLALAAAEMGHLVFSVMNTGSAAAAIAQMVDMFPAFEQPQIQIQLSEVLEGVVAQQLLPKQTAGGRVAAFEVMLANPAVRSLIREGKFYQIPSILQTGRKEGMRMMDDAVYDLYMKSDISSDTAISYAKDPADMRQKVQLF